MMLVKANLDFSIKKPALKKAGFLIWLRGLDLNQRPLGYEPNELPNCSTPRRIFLKFLLRRLPTFLALSKKDCIFGLFAFSNGSCG